MTLGFCAMAKVLHSFLWTTICFPVNHTPPPPWVRSPLIYANMAGLAFWLADSQHPSLPSPSLYLTLLFPTWSWYYCTAISVTTSTPHKGITGLLHASLLKVLVLVVVSLKHWYNTDISPNMNFSPPWTYNFYPHLCLTMHMNIQENLQQCCGTYLNWSTKIVSFITRRHYNCRLYSPNIRIIFLIHTWLWRLNPLEFTRLFPYRLHNKAQMESPRSNA